MGEAASANRSETHSSGPIVVGVDGSASSRRALDWALREASAHGNTVLAISTYALPSLTSPEPAFILSAADAAGYADDCRAVLEAEVEAATQEHSSVQVEARVIEGAAAHALISASRDAAALVVGSRGHGGFMGLLLGSVSQQCVAHAHYPVVVIHGASGPKESALEPSG